MICVDRMGNESTAASARSSRAALVVLVGAVLLEVAYVFLFSPFVTNDAATHLGSAAVLVDSIGGFDLGERFVELNRWPVPSLMGNLLLAALLPVVGVEWAERLVLIGYICALPAATVYVVRSLRTGSTWLACFAVPLTFSFCLLYGFLSFSYSIVAFLLTAGFVLRSPLTMTRSRTVGLAALLLLTFFCHIVGYLIAALFVAVVLALRALVHADTRAGIVGHGAAALLPPMALTVAYVAWSDSARGASWSAPLRKLAGTLMLEWGLVTYDRVETFVALGLAAALGSLVLAAAVRVRPWRERDPDTLGVGVFTVAVTVLVALAPDTVGSGGGFISQRLALFPALGAVIWLAGQKLSRAHVVAASIVALAVAAGLGVVRYDELRTVERIARDLQPTIACVQEGATIVQGNLARVWIGSAKRIDPLTAEAGRISAARDGLDLGNVDLRAPQWLQRFSARNDPAMHLYPGAFVEATPPPFELAAFARATGSPVDYVVLWARRAMSPETKQSSAWRRFDRSLRLRYHLAVRSPEGWWELWESRHRPLAACG